MSANTQTFSLDTDTKGNVKNSIVWRLMLALASLCIQGTGQIVCGRLRRGFLQIAAVLVFLTIFLHAGLMKYPFFGITVVTMKMLIRLYSAFDAYKISRYKCKESWAKAGITCLCVLLLNVVLLATAQYRTNKIVDNQFYPTFQSQELVLTQNGLKKYNRNTWVTFMPVAHEWAHIHVLGKIVAVAGDTFAMKNGTIWLNNKPVDEPLISKTSNPFMTPISIEPVTVPPGYVFIMKDNRYEYFTRVYGLVPTSRIKSQLLYILFSPELRKIGMRV